MASNYTENFGLCQWEATDAVLRTDFNEDNAKVDAALAAHGETLTQLTKTMGNCSVYVKSYVGNGTLNQYNAVTLSFPKPPQVVLVSSSEAIALFFRGDMGTGLTNSAMFFRIDCNWSGNTITWSHTSEPRYSLNNKGATYYVAALAKDE